MKQLYVAWQDESTRRWFPVGVLTNQNERYQFTYVKGAEFAKESGRFFSFPSFPDMYAIYEDTELFPLFANRVMPRSRPEYKDYVQWLALPRNEDDPMSLLMRSGGRSATDTLEIFPRPSLNADGAYHVHFFAHGVRYMTPEAITYINTLQPTSRLCLMHDNQNRYDPKAFFLRTDGDKPGDKQLVGYCPRYLADDLHRLLSRTDAPYDDVVVTVERVNPPPVPIQLRLLCNLNMRWPQGFEPMEGEEYRSIAKPFAVI